MSSSERWYWQSVKSFQLNSWGREKDTGTSHLKNFNGWIETRVNDFFVYHDLRILKMPVFYSAYRFKFCQRCLLKNRIEMLKYGHLKLPIHWQILYGYRNKNDPSRVHRYLGILYENTWKQEDFTEVKFAEYQWPQFPYCFLPNHKWHRITKDGWVPKKITYLLFYRFWPLIP